MIDPIAWVSTPFKNRTALLDFQGMNYLTHVVLANVSAAAGKPYRTFPLGDSIGSPRWMEAHAREHANFNAAWGILGPPNLLDYDLKKAQDFASFMFLHAEEHQRMRLTAGVS